jgi:hypothetical protein
LINGFTQLGAVLFNMGTGKVEDSFNMYASMKGYKWDERCVSEFWERFPERYAETKLECDKAEHTPYQVVEFFVLWCVAHIARLNGEAYLITDCSTFDSGLLKAFSLKHDTLYIGVNNRDIVDVGNAYLGMCRRHFSVSFVDGSAFKTCVKELGITEEFTPSTFHDHHPVNDATVIAEKWYFVNKHLQ